MSPGTAGVVAAPEAPDVEATSAPPAARPGLSELPDRPELADPSELSALPGTPEPEDLAVFLEMSSELFAVFDRERGFVWSNGAAAALLGYDEDELIGIDPVALIHPDDLAEVARVFERSAGEPYGVRSRYRCKDGSWLWLEWTARMDDDGLIYGAARDVTAGQVAQGALAANEARLQAILDNSSAAISVKDRMGRFVLVNESFLRIAGLHADDVLGLTATEIWPGMDTTDVDDRVLEGGEAFTRDEEVELADGKHVMMTVRFPLRDASSRIAGMAAIGTDITEWTQVEMALAERQRLLDTVIRACPDIVAVLDARGRVQEISEASARTLGYDLSNPVHADIEALVHPDDLAVLHAEYATIAADPDARLDLRYRVRHADGRWVVLDTRGQTIAGEDGKVAGTVLVSRDITDELEIESQMHAAVNVAEHASTAKSEFLSRMSHELRTPLNSVLGFSQLLEMDELPERQGEAVGHIMRAGRHLLNLIDEVLDIARIESGNLELLIEPVGVGDVLRDAVDLVGPLGELRDITITADVTGSEQFHVLVDRKRLLQVLLNLLSNAVKYNRAGGQVDIAVGVVMVGAADADKAADADADTDARTTDSGAARSGPPALGANVHGGMVRITVTDTGQGIGPEDIERVFEPFDRLGAERSGVEGTGVGLTLSKHLVESMGGAIGVHSNVGEGTTFTVDLPSAVAPPAAALIGERTSHGASEVGMLRVLHVEDNLANLELVEQVLTRSGVVSLLAAMTGGLGLELAREHVPDLVLLDLHLPDMSGTVLLDELRADPSTAEIPVVVVTADATPVQIQRLRDRGVAAYLTKPIDVRDLLRVVDAVADARGVTR